MTLQGQDSKMASADSVSSVAAGGARRSGAAKRSRTKSSKGKKDKVDLSITSRGRIRHLLHSLATGRFIAFDIETTGGNPEKNGITEIFALRYEQGRVVDTFYSMVNPKVSIPPIVRRMTGITNRMVKDAPEIAEVMPKLLDFIGQDVLVSHNTIGDMKFLRYFSAQVTGSMLANYYLCTHLLVEKLVSDAPDKSLKGLAQYFSLPADQQLHRAEADAYLTLELFKVLLERLTEKGITRIMDAIRFQGDFESGMRLGWGVPEEQLKQLPDAAGVFYLYDALGQLTFLSGAHNLVKEARKLQKLNQLPRQLLKSVLASTQIRYKETPTAFAASLAEAEGIVRNKVKFDPSNWHQRTANFLYVKEDGEELRFGTGPLPAGTVLALGPIRGGREVSLLMEQLSRVYRKKLSKKGLRLNHKEGRLALDFLNGRRIELPLFDKVLDWLGGLRPDPRIEEIKSELKDLSVPIELNNLEACSGLLAVPKDNCWYLYVVACGVPLKEMILAGDLMQSLKQNGQHLQLYKEIKLTIYQRRKGIKPLTVEETMFINRAFWWAYFGSRHEDVRVIPVDDLIKM
jgi:DNA polymerase III epsilon subunit family exonuclease